MITIVGAGLSGLIAAALYRNEAVAILEKQESVPNNHSAVLRFRTDGLANALNLPFKKVDVIKAIAPWRNPVADNLAYSAKTNGTIALRSSISAQARIEQRYIAPPDLISRLLAIVGGGKLRLGFDVRSNVTWNGSGPPIISTMPMPTLMEILGWEARSQFRSRPGWNLSARISNCDAYCSLYIPHRSFPGSRISLTGNEMVIECYEEPEDHLRTIKEALQFLGIEEGFTNVKLKQQTYAKILPIDEDERRRFIMWASDRFRVYSLGRYATWRPGLLLDDIVNDVRVIRRIIASGSNYDFAKQ